MTRCPACAPGLRCLACDLAVGAPARDLAREAEEQEAAERADALARRRGGSTRASPWDKAAHVRRPAVA